MAELGLKIERISSSLPYLTPIVDRSGPTHCPFPLHAVATTARIGGRAEEDRPALFGIAFAANQLGRSTATAGPGPSWAAAKPNSACFTQAAVGRRVQQRGCASFSSPRAACPRGPARSPASRHRGAGPRSAMPAGAGPAGNRVPVKRSVSRPCAPECSAIARTAASATDIRARLAPDRRDQLLEHAVGRDRETSRSPPRPPPAPLRAPWHPRRSPRASPDSARPPSRPPARFPC